MSDRGAIQDEGGQNLLGARLQGKGAALRVVAAAARALLGDDEFVLTGHRLLRSNDGFQPEEIIVRSRANHTFYSGCDGYWHRIAHARQPT